MNETAVLCLTVQNAKYSITLVRFQIDGTADKEDDSLFRMLFKRFVRLLDNYYVFVFYVNERFKFL